jgi:hypothetical protein
MIQGQRQVIISVEFLGLARRLAGCTQTQLDISDQASLRDAIRVLAQQFPSFVGRIIDPQTQDLISPYFFNVGGRFAATDLDAQVPIGEPLVLMCLDAGG